MLFRTLLLGFSASQRLSLSLWPRRNIIAFCAIAMLAGGGPIETLAQTGDQTDYIIDGLALGGLVAPKSATYREYKCRPSEQFESFVWCQRRRTDHFN
jgi:hypothetical protein